MIKIDQLQVMHYYVIIVATYERTDRYCPCCVFIPTQGHTCV